ncbi:methionyl-tRNA formyltransferase [Anderseniella sp. Alg231-50]|uniref:methionyl-tRNA formyltransferase n=1 Tax=Anderseniella sp. Alg231-50 TaxID=1922226 RepID=UPI000D5566FB
MSLRIVFMGTPDFSVPTLARLADDGHDIAAVYSQPPRAAGRRGLEERKTPVHEFAEAKGFEVRTPVSLKPAEEHASFAALQADVAVVVAYGLLLPNPVLNAPRHGCLNVHASLLPRWRGAAPIQRAIMAGDTETGVAIMQMEQGLDTGPVVQELRTAIDDRTTAQSLHDELAQSGAKAMSSVLAQLEADGSLQAVAQAEDGVTYAAKITKQEAHTDFARRASEVLRHVHGLSPFPGAWCLLEGPDKPVRVKLLQVERVPGLTGTPGTVLDEHLAIACKDEAVRPVRLQREGKAPMDLGTFLNGMKPVIGSTAG